MARERLLTAPHLAAGDVRESAGNRIKDDKRAGRPIGSGRRCRDPALNLPLRHSRDGLIRQLCGAKRMMEFITDDLLLFLTDPFFQLAMNIQTLYRNRGGEVISRFG